MSIEVARVRERIAQELCFAMRARYMSCGLLAEQPAAGTRLLKCRSSINEAVNQR